ncbi:MAG: hypothetical protein JSS82_19710 [Bacteroidetes bacterium]|nr:hypothetical protein [Bacteroidota bacterium]
MRKIVLFVTAIILLCSYSRTSYGQSDAAVIKTAQNDLQMMLSQIPVGQLEGFGFTSRSEFTSAVTGKPYRILTLNSDIYKGMQVDDERAIVAQDQWRLPVIVNGNHRLLLTVASQNGTLQTVGMGGAVLASELQKKIANADPSHQFYLFRLYSLEADFFVEATDGSFTNANFIPLYSATMAMPMLNEMHPPLTLSQLLPIIKDALKNQQ